MKEGEVGYLQEQSDSLRGLQYRAIIYNAARDGKIGRLKVFLENQKRDFIDVCLNIRDDSTDKVALVIACRNGHLEVARFLVALGADPCICGTVSFDGETIHGAPSLWAAAAAGHLDLVRFLVEDAKVDINQTTETDSSPLRGACYDGHLQIVRYLVENGADIELCNRSGHSPLMISSFRKKADVVEYLLSKGAAPSKSSNRGNTALHDAAEADSLAVCELLLSAGAKLMDDDSGVCPLVGAAVMANMEVFPLLLAHSISNLRRKDAYRILGCTLVDKKMDLDGAVKMWNLALEMELDEHEIETETLRQKTGLNHPVFLSFPEATTKRKLEEIRDDPEKIRMQALVIRERILGGAHSDVHYFLRLRGAVYCDMGDVSRCFDLWIYAVELQQMHLDPLHVSTIATLQSFQETFSIALDEARIEAAGRQIEEEDFPVSFRQIETVFTKACVELERVNEWDFVRLRVDFSAEDHEYDIEEEKKKLALIALQLIILADRLGKTVPLIGEKGHTAEYMDVKRLVKAATNLNILLLHIACCENERNGTIHTHATDDIHFPSTHCVMSLLKAGMDPRIKDKSGRTPLHIIVSNKKIKASIVHLLLDGGASMYTRNRDDETPMEIMKRRNYTGNILGKYTRLEDLAALALQRNSICFEEVVPLDTLSFVESH